MNLVNIQQSLLGAILGDSVHAIGNYNSNYKSTTALDIYRSNYKLGLRRTLAESYPACCKLVAEKFFNAMADRYIQQHGSKSHTLLNYGDTFAQFVADFKPAQQLPYLADVCKLENYINKILFGPNELTSSVEDFVSIDMSAIEEIALTLPLNSRLLATNYPVDHIWELARPDLVANAKNAEEIDMSPQQVYLFIWREGYDIRIDRLTAEQYILLQQLQISSNLVEVCNNLLTNAVKVNIIEVLPEVIKRGFVRQCCTQLS